MFKNTNMGFIIQENDLRLLHTLLLSTSCHPKSQHENTAYLFVSRAQRTCKNNTKRDLIA